MCIAIYKKAGVPISKETLEICAENNSDGCGFAVAHDGSVTRFTCMTFDEFYPVYEAHLDEYPDEDFIIHFRVATHGTVDLFNCHPFAVNDQLTFMHNGTITNCTPSITDKTEKRNDTQIFNDIVLKAMPDDFIYNDAVMELISKYIGRSKLLFIDDTGTVKIVNESLGNWDKGIWYSNYSFHKHTRSIATAPNKTHYHTQTKKGYQSKYRWNANTKRSWQELGLDNRYMTMAIIDKQMHRWDTHAFIYRPVTDKGDWLNILSVDKATIAEYEKVDKNKVTSLVELRCTYCAEKMSHSKLSLIQWKEGDDDVVCGECIKLLQSDLCNDAASSFGSWRVDPNATIGEKARICRKAYTGV